mmetsp:Transcript_163787/g.520571  ORF Transcript_163787/g.520571 Transcript_163787/m.520571 type:complete len:216 (+) Transcript_163787:766-1413(+)
MRQNTLHMLAPEVLRDLAEGLGDLRVRVSDLHQTQSRLGAIPSGHDGVRTFVLDLLVADNDGVRGRGDEAIDVTSQVDLGHVAGLQNARLALHGGEVAEDLVHRDARGEGDALLDLLVLDLLVVQLAGLLLHDLVAHLAHRCDVGIGDTCLHDLLQGLLDDVAGRAVLGGHIRVAEVGDLLALGFVAVVAHPGREEIGKVVTRCVGVLSSSLSLP